MIRDYRYPSQAALMLLQALQTPDPVQPPPTVYRVPSRTTESLPSVSIISVPSPVSTKMPRSALKNTGTRFTPLVADYNIKEERGPFSSPVGTFGINLTEDREWPGKETQIQYIINDISPGKTVLGYAVVQENSENECKVYKLAADTYAHANALLMHIYNEQISDFKVVKGKFKCIILPKNESIDFTQLLNGLWKATISEKGTLEKGTLENCNVPSFPEHHLLKDWQKFSTDSTPSHITINRILTVSDVETRANYPRGQESYTDDYSVNTDPYTFTPKTSTDNMNFSGAIPAKCISQTVTFLKRSSLNLTENKKFLDSLSDINLCQGSNYLSEAKSELASFFPSKSGESKASVNVKLLFWFWHNNKQTSSDSVCAVAVTRFVPANKGKLAYIYMEHICFRNGSSFETTEPFIQAIKSYAQRNHAAYIFGIFRDDETAAKNMLSQYGFLAGTDKNSLYLRFDNKSEDPVRAQQNVDYSKMKIKKIR